MTITHIFSDMDGTLLNSAGRLTATNAQLIQDAHLPLTLVSARAPIEMAPAITGLHLTGPQIAFNGGLIFRPDDGAFTPLVQAPIGKNAAHTLLHAIQDQFPTVSLSFYDRKHWYTPRIDEGIRYEQRLTEQAPELRVSAIEDADHLTVFKLMMICFDAEQMQALVTYLHSLHVSGVAIQRSGDAYLEITSAQALKSTGIRYILQAAGLKPETTAAFGDGHNDLPMLTLVGTPIAMANAQPEVLAACQYTTLSNDQDGVGRGIHRFLLG
ncbi:HAD family hydrolase [Lacticaseibacillus sp. GG6-2]